MAEMNGIDDEVELNVRPYEIVIDYENRVVAFGWAVPLLILICLCFLERIWVHG